MWKWMSSYIEETRSNQKFRWKIGNKSAAGELSIAKYKPGGPTPAATIDTTSITAH